MGMSRQRGKSVGTDSQVLGTYNLIKAEVKDANKQIRLLNQLEDKINNQVKTQADLDLIFKTSGLAGVMILTAGTLLASVGFITVLPAALMFFAFSGASALGKHMSAEKEAKLQTQRDEQEKTAQDSLDRVRETREMKGELLQEKVSGSGNVLTRRIGFKAAERRQNHSDAKELKKELKKADRHMSSRLGI